ncbi:MAG TPA: phenylalanine--tRNA ligase subunit alpha [Candidatus Paceibacterota bacterium]|nr:phenylalanine--tRNA ligase subunit alpha [Candidatus Paceibacterota bacterium]
MVSESEKQEMLESLSPIERKILPYLGESYENLIKKSGLENVSVLRALEFMSSKNLIELKISKKKIIELGKNGKKYSKEGLPERQLIEFIEKNNNILLNDAAKKCGLSPDEFKAAIGALRKKAMIDMKEGKIVLNAKKQEIEKESLEEQFMKQLPCDYDSLKPEQLFALKSLKERKEIIEIVEKQIIVYELTELGNSISKIKELNHHEHSIEQLTPEIIKSDSWKEKKFRRYDVISPVPKISGGKRHFVNQASDYARTVWSEMGFKEMTGDLLVSSFWNFDALFTAQDHPVREMQDTFFLNKDVSLPESSVVKAVKDSHEGKIKGSKGWQYKFDEKISKKMLLRTHTTCLSAQTLAKIKSEKQLLPQKYFAVGKCFRNETLDWKHAFEFNQTEGIVVDRNASFVHLLGYLQQFFNKMGFEKVRFRPSFFPYTEPSVEIDVWHPEKKQWLELGGAGIFRPEVTIPLLGEQIPVLAWGPGFDRMLMDYYNVRDLREMYSNDISQLRKMKFWIK